MQNKKLKITCIFHQGCMDGWMSALPIWLVYNQVADMVFVPAHYNDNPPEVQDNDYVFIVDFSYKPDVLAEWKTGSAEVFLIDHHTKAIQEVIDHPTFEFMKNKEVHNACLYCAGTRQLTGYLAFNDGRPQYKQSSGAGLVLAFIDKYKDHMSMSQVEAGLWQEVCQTAAISESYDLWHHNGQEEHDNTYLSMFFKQWLTNNRELFVQMKTHPEQSGAVMRSLSDDWNNVTLLQKLQFGRNETHEHGVKCRELCKTAYEVKLPIQNHKDIKIGFISNKDLKVSISTLGSIATREYGWDVMIMIAVVKDKEYVLSMRSNENGKNVNVADICAEIGNGPYGLSGGGHRNAAGCTIRKSDLDDVVVAVESI